MDEYILKILKHKHIFLFIWILTVLLLLTLGFFHLNTSLGDERSEEFYHIRMASEIANSKKIPTIDNGTVENKKYNINPYHLLLAVFMSFFGKEFSVIIVPLILGLLMLLIFILTLNQMGIDKERVVLIVFLTIITPNYLTTFSTLNDSSLALVLMFLAFYLLITFRSWILQLLSFLLFSLTLFFNLFAALIAVAFLVLGISIEKTKTSLSRVGIVILAFVAFFYYNNAQLHGLFIYSKEPYLGIILSDVGSFIGFSTFFLVLSLIGMGVFWKRKSELWMIYLIIFLLVLGFFLFKNLAVPYALPFLGIFAGFGFYRIIISHWKLKLLKDLTVLLILCGLLFSTISYMNRVKNIEFNYDLLDSLQWLGKNGKDGSILSYQGYGFAIEYFSGNPVVADSFSDEKYVNISSTLFKLRNIERIKQICKEYDIRYILITPEMRKGLIWSRKDEGILFLLKSGVNFKIAFEKGGYEVWEVE